MREASVGRGPRWVWGLALLCLALQVGAAVATVVTRMPGDFSLEDVYPNVVFGVLLPVLGALIVQRLGHHPIGWLFLGCGTASTLALAVYSYAEYGLVLHPGSLPLAIVAGWISSWVWTLGFSPLVTVVVLLFPDGRLPGPRWRWLLRLELATLGLMVAVNMFLPGKLQNHPVRDNPLGAPLPKALFEVLGGIAFGMLVAGMLGSAAAAVVRWRRSPAAERAQLGWFAFAAVLLVAGVAAPVPRALGDALTVVAIPLLPVSVAVAVLRRHLYGIEVVVRRSLVYVALTAVLLLGYAAVVGLLDEALRGRAQTSGALVATALVAVLFAPVRSRLQRSVDRMLYGDRHDPYAVLTGFGRRLDTGDPEADALHEVAVSVGSSLRLPFVRVEVSRAGEPPQVAEHGNPVEDVHEVPLSYRGEQVGRLLVAPRTPRDPFRAADLRLLTDLGQQVGVAAHAMLLTRDLQRSRESLVATREEERRRIRRDLHDGLGPALAGVALGLDAVARTAEDDADAAAVLAAQLKEEVHASLAEVRRLVEDLRPPALDQLGLVGAVRHQARLLTERDPGLEVTVDAAVSTTLPAAAEVAAYRIATEALNNVARHAQARHCRVGLGCEGESLLVEVEDDGVGLGCRGSSGVGLTAMHERATELGGSCSTSSVATGGTRVRALIPLGAS
ncbi:MAG TPA: histidine kinase [Marmoricola sp.]|nr:histidine kinase [Marmoricola sp.]